MKNISKTKWCKCGICFKQDLGNNYNYFHHGAEKHLASKKIPRIHKFKYIMDDIKFANWRFDFILVVYTDFKKENPSVFLNSRLLTGSIFF